MEIVRKGHEFFEMFVHQPNQETSISYTMAEQNAVSDIIAQLIDVNTKDDESIICTNCQIFDIINVPITRKRQTFRPLVIRESDQQSSPTTILKVFVDSFGLLKKTFKHMPSQFLSQAMTVISSRKVKHGVVT